MITFMRLFVAGAAGLFTASIAYAQPAMEQDGMLVDENGMTLYTYDQDSEGVSTCYDRCAERWPPLAASAEDEASGDWTIIERDDGTLQWAYMGQPLYGWVEDTAPGDTTGDGVGDVWHIARP